LGEVVWARVQTLLRSDRFKLYIVIGFAFTRFPPIIAIIDKKLLTGGDIFYGMENDEIPLLIVPIFGIVLVRVIEDTAPSQWE
jgi:hypothetical protein